MGLFQVIYVTQGGVTKVDIVEAESLQDVHNVLHEAEESHGCGVDGACTHKILDIREVQTPQGVRGILAQGSIPAVTPGYVISGVEKDGKHRSFTVVLQHDGGKVKAIHAALAALPDDYSDNLEYEVDLVFRLSHDLTKVLHVETE